MNVSCHLKNLHVVLSMHLVERFPNELTRALDSRHYFFAAFVKVSFLPYVGASIFSVCRDEPCSPGESLSNVSTARSHYRDESRT